MTELCRKIRDVDISLPLRELASTEFFDTGGSNGWLAKPPWLDAFVRSLELGPVEWCVLRKLPPGQGIGAHIDSVRGRANRGRRFHLPLLTHPGVVMRWTDDRFEIHLLAGTLYEICHTRLHEIVNRAPVDRVHLQVNTRE